MAAHRTDTFALHILRHMACSVQVLSSSSCSRWLQRDGGSAITYRGKPPRASLGARRSDLGRYLVPPGKTCLSQSREPAACLRLVPYGGLYRSPVPNNRNKLYTPPYEPAVPGAYGAYAAVPRSVLVANQKGGVLKSSIAAALSSMVAGRRRVLLVDADPQGNVSRNDLGVNPGDRGRMLAMAVQYGEALDPIRDVRPGLDVVPGGVLLGTLPQAAAVTSAAGLDMAQNLSTTLGNLVQQEQYDLTIIDSGPGDVGLLDVLLRVSRHLLVPTADDDASLEGVDLIAGRYLRARSEGAQIELLGVVLANVNHRATSRNQAAMKSIAAKLEGSGSSAFATVIRTDKAAAVDMRARHLTPGELVAVAGASQKARFAKLRSTLGHAGSQPAETWSRDGSGLAGDYQQLTREVLTRIAEQEKRAG